MTVETQSLGLPITKSGPYNGDGVTASFDYDFQIQAEDELVVTRQNADLTETVLTLTTDYTVSGVGADAGGSITLVTPATGAPSGAKLVIQYGGDYNQETDYSNQGRIQLSLLEDALDKITMHLRSLKEIADRAVTVDAFETADVDDLRTNINALAAIAADITTVAGDIADVSTVAGLSATVTTLGGLASEIAALGAIAADITSAAAVDTEITTLAALNSELAALGAIAADISTVAGISGNVTTVAGISGNVTTVAGVSADVSTLAPLSASISSLAAISANITTVAGVSSAVSTLAAISADITALANANGGTLSGIWLFSSTAYLGVPRGTTAQRGSPGASIAAIRYNTTLAAFEGWNGTAWASIGGGAGLFKGENGEVGSSAGDIFRVNEQTLNTDVTIDADENASATGPLAIASGTTLTVTSGGNLSIV